MLENLHFIRPFWLLALLPLAFLAWRACASRGRDNPWRDVVDTRLMPLLQVGRPGKTSHQALWLLSTGWLIATLAMADPTWERRPQPVFQTSAARVVVLDLSSSMNADDLKPSRLARARFKVEDVLAQTTEGQTGLVAYAGDAFTVSPLTRDANTVRSLLKVLEPDLMPAPGDRADLGLAKAADLLHQAGLASGQVLLIADGIDTAHVSATERAAAKLRSEGYTVSVLGIGTEAAAPPDGTKGALARDSSGPPAMSLLDANSLRSVACAGGGEYRTISDDGDALHALLATAPSAQKIQNTSSDLTASSWKEEGPWFVLLLLPLAALAFRRNWLLGVTLATALAAPAQSAQASTWTDAWQRPDQQAAHAIAAGDYAAAAKAASETADPKLQGSIAYKVGDYTQALADFSRASGPDADYNRGNTLARLNRYQEAITAYDKSLAYQPVNDDARANKAAVEALLKKQQQAQEQPKPQQQQQQQGANKSDSAQQQSDSDKKGQSSHQSGGQGSNSTSSAGSQGQSQVPQSPTGAGSGDQAANSRPQGNPASVKGKQQDQSSTKPDQSGPRAADKLETSPSGSAADTFAQAVKKLGAKNQGEEVAAKPSASETSGDGRARQQEEGGKSAAGRDADAGGASGHAQALESEERLAADQWLRRIPDDPGGLLRRKFLYQYRQRQDQGTSDDQ